jgi:predicted NAD-dependent protein-ADP-ribosyltransferase YbiA (DUF1768 family)
MDSRPEKSQQTAASSVDRVIRKPDGTVVELQKNGDTRLTRPDGTVTIYQGDGTVVRISADGVRTESRPRSRVRPEDRPLNVNSMASESIGRLLSNFARTPFMLDGVRYASIEAFYVCLKTDEASLRKRLRSLSGPAARAAGKGLKSTETTYGNRVIRLGSPEHHDLVKRAVRAKLEQNPEIAEEFVATYPRPIIHDTGRPERSSTWLPASVFCRILTEIREEFWKKAQSSGSAFEANAPIRKGNQ